MCYLKHPMADAYSTGEHLCLTLALSPETKRQRVCPWVCYMGFEILTTHLCFDADCYIDHIQTSVPKLKEKLVFVLSMVYYTPRTPNQSFWFGFTSITSGWENNQFSAYMEDFFLCFVYVVILFYDFGYVKKERLQVQPGAKGKGSSTCHHFYPLGFHFYYYWPLRVEGLNPPLHPLFTNKTDKLTHLQIWYLISTDRKTCFSTNFICVIGLNYINRLKSCKT